MPLQTSPQTTFTVQWQTAEPIAAPPTASGPAGTAPSLLLQLHRKVAGLGGHAAAVQAAASLLQQLQQQQQRHRHRQLVSAQSPADSRDLTVLECMALPTSTTSGCLTVSSATSAAAALLRVAAAEEPERGMRLVTTDTAAANSRGAELRRGPASADAWPNRLPGLDAFGCRVTSGAVQLPRLLPSLAVAAGGSISASIPSPSPATGGAVMTAAELPAAAGWRSVAISGGLGGLGLLAALWLAWQGATCINLLGRSGRCVVSRPGNLLLPPAACNASKAALCNKLNV